MNAGEVWGEIDEKIHWSRSVGYIGMISIPLDQIKDIKAEREELIELLVKWHIEHTYMLELLEMQTPSGNFSELNNKTSEMIERAKGKPIEEVLK